MKEKQKPVDPPALLADIERIQRRANKRTEVANEQLRDDVRTLATIAQELVESNRRLAADVIRMARANAVLMGQPWTPGHN